MSTAVDITVFNELKFTNIIKELPQQMDARLPMTFDQGNHAGSEGAAAVNQTGPITAQIRTTRYAPIVFTEQPLDRRWVYPTPVEVTTPFDTLDKLAMAIDPTGAFVKNTVNAMNRQKDDIAIAAFLADAKTGKLGASTTSFLSANIIASNYGAAAATGMTAIKLEEAKRMMMTYEVDVENDTLYCVLGAKQWKNLMADTIFTSKEYLNSEARDVLATGKLPPMMGINFIRSERLTLNGSSERQVIVYASSGMHWGVWQDVETQISQRNDLQSHPWQCDTTMYVGATRLDEKKVIEIACKES